ncbi:hypothetical protein NIES37_38150 [Tolypothrix tenuis PCC 7101]|uniref:Uncharacterized protein n=1 Tax=Tolypothrix tenuis PCC 7101 TaxID=231146 RepID=A0A1Z4N264_9CYAN|nr:hypothetical protein [Aulosira sp. FACHB-113]BAY99832.1 hypothetical protein NIES37_38150 [Tolypothrix tenuis PCC 7101]BAZ76246.1 hypothetical protein NIES50_48440 [Aulosira laxa NIES-50]
MDCLYQSKFTRKNNFSSISNAFLSKLDNLYQDLEKHYHPTSKKIKGSIEVKFHKNLFSPIGYYSDSKDCKIVWMYLSNSDGREYPAFHIGAQDLMDDTDKHFEHLWQEAGALLIRVTKDPASSLNEINKIRSSSSQT